MTKSRHIERVLLYIYSLSFVWKARQVVVCLWDFWKKQSDDIEISLMPRNVQLTRENSQLQYPDWLNFFMKSNLWTRIFESKTSWAYQMRTIWKMKNSVPSSRAMECQREQKEQSLGEPADS